MVKSVKDFFKRVFEVISKPEMQVLPGQMAFFFVLSLIPLLALVGLILTSFSVSSDNLINMLNSAIPKEVVELLLPAINNPTLSGGLIIFFFSAFLLASNGASSIITASNQIYKVDNPNFIKRRIKAILMTIILVSIILFMLLVPALGDSITQAIKIAGNGNKATEIIYIVYQVLKYPLTIFLVYFDVKLLYVLAPNKQIQSNTTTFGAVFTTIGWILATEAYSFYLSRFSKYDIFYGSLSSILILLLWVYLISYIFVLGMALSASLEQNKDLKQAPDDKIISKLDNTFSDLKFLNSKSKQALIPEEKQKNNKESPSKKGTA